MRQHSEKKKESCNDDDDGEEILFPFMIAHTGEMEWKRLLAALASDSADPIKSSRVRALLHLVSLHPIRNGLWIVNQRASQGPGRGLEQIKAFVGITWYGPSRLESTERREKRSSSWNDHHHLTTYIEPLLWHWHGPLPGSEGGSDPLWSIIIGMSSSAVGGLFFSFLSFLLMQCLY